MTDGPFKNLQLASRWKRFAEAVQNDAVGMVERCALAGDAVVREVLTEEAQALLIDLQAYRCREQLDLDPLSSVESIFNSHGKTPFTDSLQKELAFRLNALSTSAAFDEAIEASVTKHINEVQSRLEEECIRSHETGDMRRDQFHQTVVQAKLTFDTLDKSELCNAILSGDKKAYKSAVSKKEGLDEGPDF